MGVLLSLSSQPLQGPGDDALVQVEDDRVDDRLSAHDLGGVELSIGTERTGLGAAGQK